MSNEGSDTDALLAELQAKASSGGAREAEVEEDGEDIEAFLAGLESDVSPAPSVATKEPEEDPFAAEFASLGLELPPDAELAVREPEPKKESRAEQKARKAAEKEAAKAAKAAAKAKKADAKSEKPAAKEEGGEVAVVEKAEGGGLKKVAAVLRWSFYIVPPLLAVWLVGAYLAQWVSAGWLVAAVSLVVVFGTAVAFRMGTKRGRFGIWLGSLSLLGLVGLTAPIPVMAGEVLSRYGHWPSSAVGDVAGWPSEHGAIRLNSWFGEKLGGLLAGAKSTAPVPTSQKLGTSTPLSGDPGTTPVAQPPAVQPPAAQPPAAQPPAAQPPAAQPPAAQPPAAQPPAAQPPAAQP